MKLFLELLHDTFKNPFQESRPINGLWTARLELLTIDHSLGDRDIPIGGRVGVDRRSRRLGKFDIACLPYSLMSLGIFASSLCSLASFT